MSIESKMVAYYAQRAQEYERIYQKPERQDNLRTLRAFVERTFTGNRILEVACGTGYWTAILLRSAASITAIDINETVLEIARTKPLDRKRVFFQQTDAYALPAFAGQFTAGLAAFWWSHIPRARLRPFLTGLHRAFASGSTLVFIDNTYVEGISTPSRPRTPMGTPTKAARWRTEARTSCSRTFPRKPRFARRSMAPVQTWRLNFSNTIGPWRMFHNPVRKTATKVKLAIVGDFNSTNSSHIATNDAILHSSAALDISVESRWVGTEELAGPDGVSRLRGIDGVWIAPSNPYRNMDGALSAIRTARERRIPLLGTCGGFQHIILEYARNVLGFADAEHEESNPNASRLFISRLACSLVGRSMTVRFPPGSLVARLYGQISAQEQYLCNFGVNPAYAVNLRSGQLRIVGSDDEGVARVVELAEHPFFVGTLFIPQLTSTPTVPHPVVSGFLQACLPGVSAGAVLPASAG